MLGGRLGDKQPSRLLARWRGWGEKGGFVMGLQYDGKLYGRLGKRYFSTGRTANDFDELEESPELLDDEFDSGEIQHSTSNENNGEISDLFW